MEHEEYDDHRLADRAGEDERSEEAAGTGAPASDSIFEAPDLATAFLAALDAVDDRAYVSPPSEPDPAPDAAPPGPTPAEPGAAALEPGTLTLTESTPDQHNDAAASAPYAAAPADAYVVEYEPPPTMIFRRPADLAAPSPDAVAEAFAREQAALELWGTDEEDPSAGARAALAAEGAAEAAAEAAEAAAEANGAEGVEGAEGAAQAAAAPNADAGAAGPPVPPVAAFPTATATASSTPTPESQADLVLETVSNQDSYYDPDTLRLARPLFSPDEPRAFAGPVYVGDAAAEREAEEPQADGSADAEVLEDLEEFIAFSLGETRCVVPIRNVIEIGRIPDAVSVPNAPSWLHGLGNLRGQPLALIDLRAFLGIGRVRPATGRMLVLRADDEEVQAGLLVDHVHQIVSLSASRFHEVPETLPKHYARHAWGVCDYGNFTMIGLDVDALLGVENMAVEGADAL